MLLWRVFYGFMKTRCAAAIGLAIVALTGGVVRGPVVAGAQEAAPRVGQVTIILVRHAEAADDGSRDPGLSEVGKQRADQLAHVLGDLQVTHLFASQYKRTQKTLAPLAEKCGKTIETRSAREPEALITELQQLPDNSVAVVAGHSNTVPDLVTRLGGEPTGLEKHPKHGWLLPHEEYGRLFVVTLVRHSGEDLKFSGCLGLRYGNGEPAEPQAP